MAKSFGSPGIRFLQLLGQFVRIPDEYMPSFLNVYDSMKGQSKLSAYETIKREDPEYLDQIQRFGKRVGGGSLVTVYEVEMKDGSKEVARVLNPNAEYHTKNSIELLIKVVKSLSEEDPQYKQAEPLLDDMEKWIHSDIYDEAYFEDDQEFSKLHDKYQPKGFNYKIKVPKSYKTGSRLVKREEFIEGKTLTDMKDLSKEEKKEVVSLIVNNYFSQIRGRLLDKFSLVHSDVHPGNFMITPDKEVAILDRNFYLKLSLNDRLLFNNLNKKGKVEEKVELFVRYLLKQEENADLRNKLGNNKAIDLYIKKLSSQILSSISSENMEDAILDIMVQLKNIGIKIPLRITLLIKNLNSLNRMAKEVGFESLMDASEYHPPKTKLGREVIPAPEFPSEASQLDQVLYSTQAKRTQN